MSRARTTSSRTSLAVTMTLVLGSTLLVAQQRAAPSALKGIVATTQGRVAGVAGRHDGITVFKGIPFAAPPLGHLRWRAPQPAAAWSGVRVADTFSPSCIQRIVQESKPWTYEFMTHGEISEDCLYLNVWVPAGGTLTPADRRPVFMYIYGGANTEGSAAVPAYDGEGLASKGIVVVTFNYRVGILGFFSHPELSKEAAYHASGNYGLLDQIAAARWIKDNIAAFGGDPSRVTIAGQSAGAAAVHSFTASPLAKGLFHRAIAESGSTLATLSGGRAMADQEGDGTRFVAAKNARSVADLRLMSWQDIVSPIPAAAPGGGRAGGAQTFRWAPVIDGYALTTSVGAAFASGHQNDVPTLTGSNADENGAVPHPTTTLAAFTAQARQRYGDQSDAFLALYPATSDEDAKAAMNASARDQARISTMLWATTRAKTAKTKAYTYFWSHPLPGPDVETYGAFHTSEVPYALNTLEMSNRPFVALDHRLANQMSSYWANFVRTGNPNGPGLPHWPDVFETPNTTMEIGNRSGAIPVAGSAARIAFWSRWLTK